MDIGHEIKILSKDLERHLNEHLKKDNITSAQFRLLLFLSENSRKVITQKDICEVLELKHTTVIGLIKRMKEKDLLNCAANKENGRYKDVFLTEKGRQYASVLHANRDIVQQQLLEDFSGEELKQLEHLIAKLKNNIKKLQ